MKEKRLRSGRRRGHEAELLQHQEPVKHQAKRGVLPIADAEHLDVVERNRAASRRYVSIANPEYAVVGTCKSTFLNGNVIDNVKIVDVDAGVRKCHKPAGEEIRAGCLSLATNARRLEDNIVGEHCRKTVYVMSVEGVRPLLERFACSHDRRMPRVMRSSIEGGTLVFLASHPGLFSF